MAVKIEFETSNAAFADDGYAGGEEFERILKEITKDFWEGHERGSIRDANGNRIGSWKATIDAEESGE